MTVRFSVAHGLDAGQRGTAGSEGSQDKEHCHIPRRFDDRRRLRRLLPEHEHTHKARHDERKDSEDEEIRGHAEHDRRLAHASEVAPREDADDDKGDPRLVCRKLRERRRRGKPRRFAEIIRADDLRAAALRVGIYRLPVAEH